MRVTLRPIAIVGMLTALSLVGCSAHSTTLTRDGSRGQVIYRISEERAFTTALEAYAYLYPKQNVDDIVDGARRGYNAHERTAMDWWAHRLLVIPAVGTDDRGNEVR